MFGRGKKKDKTAKPKRRFSNLIRGAITLIFILFALQTASLIDINAERSKNALENIETAALTARLALYLAGQDEQTRSDIAGQNIFYGLEIETPAPEAPPDTDETRIPRFEMIFKKRITEQARLEPADDGDENKEGVPGTGVTKIRVFHIPEEIESETPLPEAQQMLRIFVTDTKGDVFAIRTIAAPLMFNVAERTLFFFMISTFFVIVVVMWLLRHTARPYLALQNAAENIAKEGPFLPVYLEGKGEIKSAFQAFNAMQNRIKGLLDERRHMIASLSHDLRTILTRLSLRLDYMENDEQRDRATQDIGYMERYLEQMVTYGKSEESAKPDLQSCNLLAVIRNIAATFEGPGFGIHYKGDTEGILAETDPVMLERIAQNVFSNASRYASEVTVTLTAYPKKGRIRIDFADNGPGLNKKQKKEMFTPYASINAARSKNDAGSGLGFMIIRNFATLLNGTVSLHDNKPRGLIVRLELPVNAAKG